MISHRQRELIRASFARIRVNKERAGELFYHNLFTLTPGLIPLFDGTSVTVQGSKLMQILEYVVDHLEEWSTLEETAKQLGARHAGYGVQPDHYAAAGAALMATLTNALGTDFTDETQDAWMEFYTHLSLMMEKGARGPY